MFNTLRKKIAVDQLVYPWNVGLSCGNCTQQFTVTRRKKHCVFCNTSFCTLCIERRPDKRLSCHKCVVLTSRPIDRDELFNLKSRDLIAYLSSRHISTSGFVEKEDLVNAVVRSVSVPPSYSSHNRWPDSGSCPTSPQHTSVPPPSSSSYSHDDLRSATDGIRVSGMQTDSSSSATTPEEPFVIVEATDCDSGVVEAPTTGEAPAAAATDQPPAAPPETVTPTPVTPTPQPKKWLQLSDIPSQQDLETLSIRQLKELLAYNRIDYSGCVERSDLVEKASRLWAAYKESRQAVDQLSHDDLCKICMDAPIECVLLECGHTCTCTQCGKQLSECPICRQFVVRCVRTFKA